MNNPMKPVYTVLYDNTQDEEAKFIVSTLGGYTSLRIGGLVVHISLKRLAELHGVIGKALEALAKIKRAA
jgi:hypothetical protein